MGYTHMTENVDIPVVGYIIGHSGIIATNPSDNSFID